MGYQIHPMNDTDAQAISKWHYEDPYSFYDMAADPHDMAELLDAGARADSYWAVTDEHGALVGYFGFNIEDDMVDVGLGLHPDLTGKGYGLEFLHFGLDFITEKRKPSAIVLYVATFNQRAIHVYEKAGFETVQRLMVETNGGQHEFVKMIMHLKRGDPHP